MAAIQDIENVKRMLPQYPDNWALTTAIEICDLADSIKGMTVKKLF